ncbi:MAG: glycosyltransferase, partial [Spirochaetia bacterium]|nr:glycosyltransferase [Spirochaetia bacterium]
MRILQVSKLYPPKIGGVERVVQQIAEGLNDKTDMQVLVCQEKGKGSDEPYEGVKVHRSGSLGVFLSMPLSFSFIRDVRKFSKNADIIHFHMPFPLADL